MLAAAIALILAASPQQASPWGQYQWDNGTGFLSRYYFENRTGFPSGYMLANSTRAGSFYYLLNGTGPGSAYFWRFGRTAGSEHYWRYGRGCLSETGWRYGARCTGAEALILKTACIAAVIDISPCQAIRTRLDEWLAGTGSISSTRPSDVVAEMRQPFD